MLDYYDGSRTFSWLGNLVGLPIDQTNFLLTQFTALALAGVLRKYLNPTFASATIRHVFGLVFGLFLGYFCFGRQAVHLAGLPTICYLAMRTQDPRHMQRVVLATALFYLSCVHYHRMIYNYGSYTLDITGPLMVITQKVTSVAFNLHDGLARREEDLTPMQRDQAVKEMPTALEYFSYVFHFQGLMAGPVLFYRDYIDFIHGRNLHSKRALPGHDGEITEHYHNPNGLQPSPMETVVKKVLLSLICAATFVVFIPMYPIQRLKEQDFLENTTIFYKMWYLAVATMLVRFKYYHAWIFADAICNNSGLGFNGYNQKGEAQWDLISNVDVFGFETSLSFKQSIENWNTGTNRWLRCIAYERAKSSQKILLTYSLSALWHGFYPGYYLTFANGAFFTVAARRVRRTIRPYFLGSKQMKFLYDILTFMATRIALAYTTFSFVLLEFVPSLKVYLSLYLIPHIMGLVAILIVPRLPKAPVQKDSTEHESKPSQSVSNGTARKTM